MSDETASTAAPQRRRIAANTAIFSIATGASRIAGLIREVVAAALYGVAGPISAFTFAFQIPNLVRALVADAALSAAFVPVFTDLLEKKRRREAIELAGALFGFILVALSVLTLLFIVIAPIVVPPLTGDGFDKTLDNLTVGLSQVMFPILILLGLNGLVVGILNAYDHFAIPAIAPLVWNVVIIVVMVGLQPFFSGPNQVYAYAIGIVLGTAVQFAMALPVLKRVGFPLRISLRWDPRITHVARLMLPVSIGLGIINLNLLINSGIGLLISEDAPRAIDAAFRIYMLPQGMFSVAVATVLFPTLARMVANANFAGLRHTTSVGVRQIYLLLIPASAATIALAEPITRLVFQRGEFDSGDTNLVAEALFWFSFSLPFSGVNLLLTRTFFSLQRPWFPTALGAGSLAINAVISLALYKPLGIPGIVIGTAVSSLAMTLAQTVALSRELDGMEERETATSVAVMTLAAIALGCVSYLVWAGIDEALGRSLIAQMLSVGIALSAGTAVYAAALLWLEIPEARQITGLIRGRIRPNAS